METEKYQGRILSAISGFYWVQTEMGSIRCQPRGIFRKEGFSPVVGDIVECSVSQSQGTILKICERKNYFVRPPLANLDQLFFVVSTCQPTPNFFVLDQLLAIAEYQQIEPILVITKGDIAPCEPIVEYYRTAGFPIFCTNTMTKRDFSSFLQLLEGKVSAVCGNTGVGKSTFLNTLLPELALATGETSEKLGRGRHTTRTVKLFEIGGGYLADTPGFSTVTMERYGTIPKEELERCFGEFAPYLGTCRFHGCSHRTEPGCAVVQAVNNGDIPELRYQSYRRLYKISEQTKSWNK